MTVFVRALSQKAAERRDAETLNWLMIFSSAGLLISLLYLMSGIDVGPGLAF